MSGQSCQPGSNDNRGTVGRRLHWKEVSGPPTERRFEAPTDGDNSTISRRGNRPMVSNELDRILKRQFGWVFVTLTSFFTSLSCAIVVLNGIFNWNISPIAITGL